MSYYKRKAQIKAEIRNFFGIPDIAVIIKKIEAICGDILSCSAITSTKKRYKSWQLKLQLLVLYEKYRASNILLRSSEDVTEFIRILNSACEIFNDPDAPKSVKTLIKDFYRRRMKVMAVYWWDKPYTKELFARRNELPQDSPFIFEFLEWTMKYIGASSQRSLIKTLRIMIKCLKKSGLNMINIWPREQRSGTAIIIGFVNYTA